MPRRSPLPVLLIVSMLLSGCAQTREGTDGPPQFVPPVAGPSVTSAAPTVTPSATTPAPTAANPTPSRSPKRTTAPTRSTLPAGLKRTTGVRAVALTFDDGPHPTYTPRVLDQLRAAGVKATFCVVGVNVRRHPALVARIAREGHTLCNHSWNHDFKLGTRSAAKIRADIGATDREIKKAVPGANVRYYRQPGGMWTPGLVHVVKSLDMVPLHWDVDPRDWAKATTSAQITQRVLAGARAGSIVLLHDGGGDRSRTLSACPSIIRKLKQKYGIAQLK